MDNKDENYQNAIPEEKNIRENIGEMSDLLSDMDLRKYSPLGQTKDSLLTIDSINGAEISKVGETNFDYPNTLSSNIQSDITEVPNTANSIAETPVSVQPEDKKPVKQSIVRTFKGDAEDAVKMERLSSMSIAIAEQKKRLESGLAMDIYAPSKTKKIAIIFASLFFLVAGIGAISFSYFQEKIYPKTEKLVFKSSVQSFIITDSSAEINLNKTNSGDMVNLLTGAIRRAGIKSNSIQNIYITENNGISDKGQEIKKMIESKKFIALANFKMPNLLSRSLLPEFMLGLHYWNGNQPFLILKTDSYGNAFSGMLEWEKDMKKDFDALFSLSSRQSSKIASSTDDIFANERDFEDVFVKNKDARAIRGGNGEIFLIYDLHDKDTVIITTNTSTLAEISDRLVRARTVR